MEEQPEFGLRGGGGIGPAEGGRVGVALIEPDVSRDDEPTLDDVRTALVRPDGHVAWVGDGTGAGLATR